MAATAETPPPPPPVLLLILLLVDINKGDFRMPFNILLISKDADIFALVA